MKSSRTKLPELLAPAGSRKAFLGALKAGADAVYLGGEKFGARAYAENFTFEDIVRSIREAHIFGCKVYLTLNVLTKESEFEETLDFAKALTAEGLDGAIVQDLGLIRALRTECPGLDIHASTQMSVSGPESVRFLKELGVVRVVPARELSLDEIRAIKREEPVDVECFIHGAMCYSYSGRCLMSSFLGGRSGNRGRCAGTCRLPYKILDPEGQHVKLTSVKGEEYPLSMRDLCVLEILPDLIDAGIDSFKIEGRMKSPHYAAGVTALYRKYIDHFAVWDAEGRKRPWKVSAQDMRRLRSLYLRSDLSTGYYYKRNGRELLTIGKPGYAGTDDALLEEIEKQYLVETRKKKIDGRAVLIPGERACLTVTAERPAQRGCGENAGKSGDAGTVITASVCGETVQRAQKRPLSGEEIEKRLRKTGDSVFEFDNLEVDAKGEVFLPVASLNALRRDALSLIEEKILQSTGKQSEAAGPENNGDPAYDRNNAESGHAGRDGHTAKDREELQEGISAQRPEIWAQVMTSEQLRAALRCGVSHIIAEETPDNMAFLEKNAGGIPDDAQILLALPHAYRRSSLDRIRSRIGGMRDRDGLERVFQGVMVRTLEELDILEKEKYNGAIIADGSLYQWNREARDLLLGRCDMISTGWELSAKDMLPLMEGAFRRQLVTVYGRVPMMITAGCVKKTAGRCSRREEEMYFVEDRKGMRFPVRCVCSHCSNVIYNSLPLSLHSFVCREDPVLMSAGGWVLSFTTESGDRTQEILRFYASGSGERDAKRIFKDFTTGHFRKSAI